MNEDQDARTPFSERPEQKAYNADFVKVVLQLGRKDLVFNPIDYRDTAAFFRKHGISARDAAHRYVGK